MPAQQVAGEWLMTYSGTLTEDERARAHAHFGRLIEQYGPDQIIGVVSKDDVLVAVSRRHNYTTREHARQVFGEDRWQRCRLPGLNVADRVHAAAKQSAPETPRTRASPRNALRSSAPRPAPKRPIRERVVSFLRAVIGPGVDNTEYRRRLAICRSNRCGHLRTEGDRLYCGACGCGQWRLAELHTKLRFAELECPADPPLWTSRRR